MSLGFPTSQLFNVYAICDAGVPALVGSFKLESHAQQFLNSIKSPNSPTANPYRETSSRRQYLTIFKTVTDF